MRDEFLSGLSLAGAGGHFIVAVILVLLALAVLTNLGICARYRGIERELREELDPTRRFRNPVLAHIVRDVREALSRSAREINTQAIIERNFQSHLGALLVGERFGRSAVGLMIILGLVGTFYGLTLSIGKLVSLVSGDPAGAADITVAVTKGLAQALSGMSVAFSASLFGIGAAIVMTLVGVFFNVGDRRAAAMVRIEHYVDNVLLAQQGRPAPDAPERSGASGATEVDWGTPGAQKLEQALASFGQSVARLEQIMGRFDSALQGFSTTTRDFREFNLHLKDNVQRMSLGFGDLSETLKAQVAALKPRDPRQG